MATLGVFIFFAIATVFFVVYRVSLAIWSFLYFIASIVFLYMPAITGSGISSARTLSSLFLVLATLCLLFSIPIIRKNIFFRSVFKYLRNRMPTISETEQQLLGVGDIGFEGGFFTGSLSWNALREARCVSPSIEEQKFLDGPVRDLCEVIDNWEIRHINKGVPRNIWDFILENGFLGLRVAKEDGGQGFSFQTQSTIISTIASRSLDIATIVGVQNSLSPDALIKRYGTDEQREYYLPRFSKGKEIVAFAITSPHGGSDVPSMADVGYITNRLVDGKGTLGIRLTWNKRYITFAPKATLFVLAFRLFDPDRYLGTKDDLGITLALIPPDHKGVISGQHHILGGAVFPNGPTVGTDVFIPIDWVIGGRDGIGIGWKMITESLFIGRAITLPALSSAAAKAMLRYTTAYAVVRRQFGRSIGTFEGVEEHILRLVEASYLTDSARSVTAAIVDRGGYSPTVASLMKYQTTEYARRAANDAMDVHGGRGICDGPSNYLQAVYQMAPIGITVEGSNIITRSLMTFAQGILRAHPYMHAEMGALRDPDERYGLTLFDRSFSAHISLVLSNMTRAIIHNLTRGIYGSVPSGVPKLIAPWHKYLWRATINFAFVADIVAVFLGGNIKKKQKISGRIADALSELYLLSCILKRYEDDGFPKADYPIVEFCVRKSLHRFWDALHGVTNNFPNRFIRLLLRLLLPSSSGNLLRGIDEIGHEAAMIVLHPGATRDRLTRHTYIANNRGDPVTILESAFMAAEKASAAYEKIYRAIRKGALSRVPPESTIDTAVREEAITPSEYEDIQRAEEMAERVIGVDTFEKR